MYSVLRNSVLKVVANLTIYRESRPCSYFENLSDLVWNTKGGTEKYKILYTDGTSLFTLNIIFTRK